MSRPRLVLWDIDRTLLYVGEVDRRVYCEVFVEVVGRQADVLPERGSGVTVPRALRQMLVRNGVSDVEAGCLVPRMLGLLPLRLAARVDDLKREGVVLPGAAEALDAAWGQGDLVSTVVTGNLKASALVKLSTLGLADRLYPDLGGYSCDDDDRPSLVGIAQRRAAHHFGTQFTAGSTVVVGDSLEDVRTGGVSGAAVIGVASGTTSAEVLRAAGADVVLDDLRDTSAVVGAIRAVTAGA